MKRRELLVGAAGAIAAGSAMATQSSARSDDESKTYVLVHGTWLGGWSWGRVRALMRAAGHEVYTPTLTGCGERYHLSNPEVGLETHIQDIVSVIECEELDNVILVGHSFSGVAITGAADRLRDRIRRLVYFDALVPAGNRMSGVRKDADGNLPSGWAKKQQQFIDGYQMDFFASYPMKMLIPEGDTDNEEWARRRLTPHPAKTWTDDLVIHNGGYDGLPKTYVLCNKQVFGPTNEGMYGPALNKPDWDFVEFPYPRAPMMTHPQPTAELLMSLS